MTVPSTEELQRLLDEATPGEWAIDEETGRIYSQKDGVIISGIDLYQKIDPEYSETEPWIDWRREVDGFFAALAPVLAAEVIRLREENERLTRIEWLAEQAAESDSGLAYDLDQINREYEGGQA